MKPTKSEMIELIYNYTQKEQDDLHNTIGILGIPGLGDYREKLKRRIQLLKAIRTIIEGEGEDEK